MAVHTNIYGKSEPQYAGCVLSTYERNGYDDSDWYAICWDEEQQKVVHVEYDTTRCGGYGTAEIDATPETLRKVYRYYKSNAKSIFDTRINPLQAKKIQVGEEVVVVRGRKIPKGTVGKCFWLGTCYNPYSRKDERRAGIEADGERFFVPEEYIEPVDWESRLMKGKDRKNAIRLAAIDALPRHYQELFLKNLKRSA